MGGFLTGLFQTVGTGLREKNAQHQKQQAEEKQRQVDTQWTAMQTAVTTLDRLKRKQDSGEELTPEETQQAQQAAGVWQASQQEYGKLTKSNKPVNEAFQKFGGFVSKILTSKKNQLNGPQQGGGGQQPQTMDKSPVAQPAAQASAQPQAPSNPLTGPPAAQAQPPEQPPSQPLTGPPKPQQAQIPQLDPKQRSLLYGSPQFQAEQKAAQDQENKLALEQKEYDVWLKRGKEILGPNADPRDLAEYAGSKGTKLPAKLRSSALEEKREQLIDAYIKTGKPRDEAEKLAAQSLIESSQKKVSTVPRSLGQISVTDARKMQAANPEHEYKDEKGNAIDLDSLPVGMELKAVALGDKTFFVPLSQNQTHIPIGGQWVAVGSLDQQTIPQGGGTVLGPSRTATASTGQTPVYNPDTREFEMFTTHRTTTPVTPGPPRAPAAATQSAQPAAPQQGHPSSPPATPHANAPPTSPNSMGNRIPSGQRSAVVSQGLPIQEATMQFIGDPEKGIRGLKDFSALADKPDSVKRIGEVLNYIFDDMDSSTGGAHISAGAGPVSVSTGGLGELLQNAFDVPLEIAQQKTRMYTDAINKLTPEEQEYVNSVMSSFAASVGLRSLSRASAAQASVRSIERELPTIGVKGGVVNSKAYDDKMKRLYVTLSTAFENMPKGAVPPKVAKAISALNTQKASPGGTLSGPNAAKKISSKAEYDALPAGAKYIDSDGKTYTKK